MGKNDFLKRVGQMYSVAIQRGYTEEELLLYMERSMSWIYLTDKSKQKEKVIKKEESK